MKFKFVLHSLFADDPFARKCFCTSNEVVKLCCTFFSLMNRFWEHVPALYWGIWEVTGISCNSFLTHIHINIRIQKRNHWRKNIKFSVHIFAYTCWTKFINVCIVLPIVDKGWGSWLRICQLYERVVAITIWTARYWNLMLLNNITIEQFDLSSCSLPHNKRARLVLREDNLLTFDPEISRVNRKQWNNVISGK
jgi:hypothetical protein